MKANKNVFVIISLFFSISLSAQKKSFILNGLCKGIENGKVELIDIIGDTSNLSGIKLVEIKNGIFKFCGQLKYSFKAKLKVNDSLFSSPFFICACEQKIVFNVDSLKETMQVENSKINNEFVSIYKPYLKENENELNDWDVNNTLLENRYNHDVPAAIKDSLKHIYVDLISKRDIAFANYVKKYPNSEVALWHLYFRAFYYEYDPVYLSTYYLFSSKIKKSTRGKALKNILDVGKNLAIGSRFPKFSCFDSTGRAIKIDTKIKYPLTLIDVWFSSCAPCLSQLNDLKKCYEKFKDYGFSIIGISIDQENKRSEWLRIVNKYELPWEQFWDIDGKEVAKLNINSFPSNFLIDRAGKIIKKDLAPIELKSFLESIFEK